MLYRTPSIGLKVSTNTTEWLFSDHQQKKPPINWHGYVLSFRKQSQSNKAHKPDVHASISIYKVSPSGAVQKTNYLKEHTFFVLPETMSNLLDIVIKLTNSSILSVSSAPACLHHTGLGRVPWSKHAMRRRRRRQRLPRRSCLSVSWLLIVFPPFSIWHPCWYFPIHRRRKKCS